MRLSVIIPTCNRNELLEETLLHLYESTRETDAEIIIVNDSKVQQAKIPDGAPVPVRVLNNPMQGPGSARNLGAGIATGELILFLDDDILVNRAAILRTLALHEAHPHSALNLNWKYPDELVEICHRTKFGRYLLHNRLDRYEGWVTGLDWKKTELFEVPKVAAFYLSISKSDFERVKGFDTAFIFQGAEDTELSKRLVNAGIKLFVDPTVYVQHKETDRLTLKSRLNRTKASAFNRRTASDLGMKDYVINHGKFKLLFYRFAINFKGLLIGMTNLVPNHRFFDFLYRRIVNMLIGISLYQGYYLREKEMYSPEPNQR
ncbi:MAG TPA: glycosyltransferase [Bacteroidia bacterium]|nr:glycosyltransferase [Bacteroidia bacterium]